jgi:hypothetical protein
VGEKGERNMTACLVKWYILVIPALGRLKQEDHEFNDNLLYIVSLRSA